MVGTLTVNNTCFWENYSLDHKSVIGKVLPPKQSSKNLNSSLQCFNNDKLSFNFRDKRTKPLFPVKHIEKRITWTSIIVVLLMLKNFRNPSTKWFTVVDCWKNLFIHLFIYLELQINKTNVSYKPFFEYEVIFNAYPH